jgi:lambda repressor-like predicted transcriptional regulator
MAGTTVRVARSFGPIDALLADKLSGASALRKQKRDEELEHARKLAAIRAESHGPVWTGTPEQLIATVTHWYESGWIAARSLEDALRQVGRVLVREDGNPVIQSPLQASSFPSPAPDMPKDAQTRRQFILPLLEQRGWSILDWANEAQVSHSTAQDYLENRRNPYRSTRLKLAKSLGVSIQLFPR